MKNGKYRGWVVFLISLVLIVVLLYITQSGSLGTKLTVTGGDNSLQKLLNIESYDPQASAGQVVFKEEESNIAHITTGDNGVCYIITKTSGKKPSNISKYCDYYINFITQGEADKIKFFIDCYNANVSEHNNNLAQGEAEWNEIVSDNIHVDSSWLATVLPYISILVVVVLGIILVRNVLNANSKSFTFGKVKAQVAHNVKIRFTDVAGIDEEKEELQEVVEFLRNPQKFTELGAKIPKGILMVGLPGTGKTLLAKAIAGESNVPFFSISGSDFVEMFVGVGASRVRDLFEQAKREAPCIVFIDEIDAVGRQRGAGLGGGNDEREQTLNQLLVQMDGFESNAGVIVIAATNRSDVLDPALLRPGRFDRQIYLNPPDVRGRELILKIHARNKPIDSAVNFETLARMTVGFTGADLENLLNEAAILAAREDRHIIMMNDIIESIDKVIMGPQKKSRIITESDKRITACHEAGHAIIGKVLEHCDVVQEVSIIGRGMAAGYTMSRPDNDNQHVSYNKLIDNITMMFGGRAAEEILMKDICTGAQNDIEKATKLARRMVTEWGMSSKFGLINFGENSEVFLGRDYQTQINYSEKTAAQIDDEVKNILDSCYERAKTLIKNHIKEINTMVDVLLEKETIYFKEVEMIMSGKSTKQVLIEMDKEEIRNKERIEIERAEAELEKVKKEQAIRIKTAEALKNGGVLSTEELDKVRDDSAEEISKAEKKVEELKQKYQEKNKFDESKSPKKKDEETNNKPSASVKKKTKKELE